MKTKLQLDSATYLRRLVRELNSLPDGFYVNGIRCNRASFTEGYLQVRPLGTRGFRAFLQDSSFTDAYGRNVCASRHA